MFPKIKIITDKVVLNESDILKDINDNYHNYFKSISSNLNDITSHNYKFINNFKINKTFLWYSNNLFERNINKGSLINNFLISTYINKLLSQNIKILIIECNSKDILMYLRNLNPNIKLKIKNKFNIFKFYNSFYLLRSIIFFFKIFYTKIKVKNDKSYIPSLKQSNNLIFVPYENQMNNAKIYKSNQLGSFMEELLKIHKSKMTYIHYLPSLNVKYNNDLFSFLNSSNKDNKYHLNLEILSYYDIFLSLYYLFKFYISKIKYTKQIKSYLVKQNKEYLYYLLKNDLLNIFSGPILLQNIIDIIIFNKINKIIKDNCRIFYIFENQFWEKNLLQVLKSKNNRNITGVQNTPPKLWDSSLYLDYGSKLINRLIFPNFILYSSNIYLDLISISNKNLYPKLIYVESTRYHFLKFKKNIGTKNNILIMGDGNSSNNLILNNFVKSVFNMHDFNFTYRKHPYINKDKFILPNSLNQIDIDLINNKFAIISNSSNSYIEIIYSNSIPLVLNTDAQANQSIFKILNLTKFIMDNNHNLTLNIKNYCINIDNTVFKNIINKIILIDTSYTKLISFFKEKL